MFFLVVILIHVSNHTILSQWLEKVFLGYFAEWDEMVHGRENFTATEKKKMTLSKDTLVGLRMTGVEIVSNYNAQIILCIRIKTCT